VSARSLRSRRVGRKSPREHPRPSASAASMKYVRNLRLNAVQVGSAQPPRDLFQSLSRDFIASELAACREALAARGPSGISPGETSRRRTGIRARLLRHLREHARLSASVGRTQARLGRRLRDTGETERVGGVVGPGQLRGYARTRRALMLASREPQNPPAADPWRRSPSFSADRQRSSASPSSPCSATSGPRCAITARKPLIVVKVRRAAAAQTTR
jgi:hypothetical protein